MSPAASTNPDGDAKANANAGAQRTSFALRLWRTACLHADTYEEVEADRSAIGQATLVVVVACLASMGGALLRIRFGAPLPGDALPLPWHLALVGLEPLVAWLVGSAFAFMVGATFFKGPETETDYLEILRTTGFAFGPAVFSLLVWLPAPFGMIAIGTARTWVLVASIIAIRQALDFTTLRALGTYGVSILLLWLVLWGLAVTPVPF